MTILLAALLWLFIALLLGAILLFSVLLPAILCRVCLHFVFLFDSAFRDFTAASSVGACERSNLGAKSRQVNSGSLLNPGDATP